MLQFKRAEGPLNFEERERERALLAEHEEDWLGELSGIVTRPIFKKGFLSECAVRRDVDLRPMELPQWSTVRRIAGSSDVIHARRLTSLESIGPIEQEDLFQLQIRPALPRVKELIIEVSPGIEASLIDWVPHVKMLPRLKRLALQYPEHIPDGHPRTFRPAPYANLLARPDLRGISSFAIRRRVMLRYGHGAPSEEWIRLAPWLQFFRSNKRLEKLRLEISRGWAFRLHRVQNDLLLVAEWNSRAATGTLKALRFALDQVYKGTFKRIHIEQTGVRLPHHAEALARALKGLEGATLSLAGDRPLDPART